MRHALALSCCFLSLSACTEGPGRLPDALPFLEDAAARADAREPAPDAAAPADAGVAEDAPDPGDGGPGREVGIIFPDAGSARDAAPSDTGTAPSAYTFTTLGRQAITSNGVSAELELIRATRSDGRRAYLAYLASGQAGPRPAVVITDPYSGIAWTQDTLETQWSVAMPDGTGLYPDQNCPERDPTGSILYTPPATYQSVADGLIAHRFNGFGAVLAYGRFYGCDPADGDAEDAVAALTFLSTRPQEVDTSRVGIGGASWGGFMALWGAAASPIVRPIVVSALYPPSDLPDLSAYNQTLMTTYPFPEDLWFFLPYQRRLTRSPVAAQFTRATLCANLPSDVTIYHDFWDVLVPVSQTQALAAACGAKVKPTYWRRASPPDWARVRLAHGLMDTEVGQGFSLGLTLVLTHLHLGIADPNQAILEPLDPAYLTQFVALARQAQLRGESVQDMALALAELASPRVNLQDLRRNMNSTGADLVVSVVNQIYGTRLTAGQIEAQLRTQGLPRP